MGEGMSLAGITETPLVVHIAQRPGPATGLPTRTEQGDLELALYAGHGEFPRVIYAPGTIQDAYRLAAHAFNVTDRYQIPVIILSDEFLVDSYANFSHFDRKACSAQKQFIETAPGYKRYALTEDGISPRGIPGYGRGLVMVDSDEHDEDGHITESMSVRTAMVDKRLKRLEALKRDAVQPELIGPKKYKTLLVGWGSTYHAIREALDIIGAKDVAFLHCKQVYPLSSKTVSYLEKAKRIITVENNATAQFGKLITRETGIKPHHRVLKYTGMPFAVEELVQRIKKVAL